MARNSRYIFRGKVEPNQGIILELSSSQDVKESKMKKTKVLLVVILSLVLSACGGQKSQGDKEKFTIGVVQIIEHEALDNARMGFEDQIKELGINAKIEYKNAQGEISTARTIVEKFISDEVDLIYAIATPAAEAAASSTDRIPILFSAVTDAEKAGLVESNEKPGANVTGTSDAVNIEEQLALFKEIDPTIKKIGVLFSADEQNSFSQIEEMKKVAGKLNLEVEDMSIQNISDLPIAAESLAKKVDGFYVLTDNKIASSISLLTDVAKAHKLPTVCVEEAHVNGGGLISKGISYYKLGQQTADLAQNILVEGKDPGQVPVERSKEVEKIINKDTINALGLDPTLKVFQGAKDIKSKGE